MDFRAIAGMAPNAPNVHDVCDFAHQDGGMKTVIRISDRWVVVARNELLSMWLSINMSPMMRVMLWLTMMMLMLRSMSRSQRIEQHRGPATGVDTPTGLPQVGCFADMLLYAIWHHMAPYDNMAIVYIVFWSDFDSMVHTRIGMMLPLLYTV